jgi:long-chain acyl-CoA synthetase
MADTRVMEERESIEASIAGRTVCDELLMTAEKCGDLPAYSARAVTGEWDTLTWAQARQRVLELAAAFAAVGIAPGDAVALMMPNRPEHVLADLGVVHARGVPTTVYATLPPGQVQFVAAHCAAKIAVLNGQDELNRWLPVLDQLPDLRTVVVMDPAARPSGERFMTWADFVSLGRERLHADPAGVMRRWQAVDANDPVTLLYTSGTTGNPKGVALTHHNVLYEAVSTDRTAGLPESGTAISYLPLAHIAERVLSIYIPVHLGWHLYFCPDATQLLAALQEVHPTAFFGVPRVWEKFMAGLAAMLNAELDEERKAGIKRALDVGRAYVAGCEYGRTPSAEVSAAYEQADATVLSRLRALIGLDQAKWLGSAAAPMPLEVARFFSGLGMTIFDVYGMTETTGAVTANRPDAFKLGTVGQPLPGNEIRIADDGEIFVRGSTCCAGYLNRPEATEELLDADAWLHTGDVGSLDEDGFLSIVDRKKELIITAGGENISPSNIENLLKEHPLVGQALAFGDRRPHVVALLTLDGETAPGWAKSRGIAFTDLATLAENPDVLEEVGRAVEAANARLARVEQVRKWRLLPFEWTAESEELTPTLKLKRRVVHTKYTDVIDSMYGG